MPSSFAFHADLGIEHLTARLGRQRFTPHAHDDYLIGVTLEGVESLVQRGRHEVSCPGNLRMINPGEVHAGGAADGLWAYQALYIPPARLVALLDLPDGAAPRFNAAVAQDAFAVSGLIRLLRLLRHSRDCHERETALMLTLSRLVDRHGEAPRPPVRPLVSKPAIATIKSFLNDRLAERVSLADLATETGLSRFHLLRQFKSETGLTPWQYQAHLRVIDARRRLRAGERASQVAHSCGFVDQSHFTRVFRQISGFTPGAYATAHGNR